MKNITNLIRISIETKKCVLNCRNNNVNKLQLTQFLVPNLKRMEQLPKCNPSQIKSQKSKTFFDTLTLV